MSAVEGICRNAKEASVVLANLPTGVKNKALLATADALVKRTDDIIQANKKDLEEGKRREISGALMDRLLLDAGRIEEMAQSLRDLVALKDPIGEVVKGWRIPNGLLITIVRVPLGVVSIIYEARPNVTVDAAGLCMKTGNAAVLRGSSVAINSNLRLTEIIAEAASQAGLPLDAVQSIPSTSREQANELMRMHEFVDVLIPRGGAALINNVVENSTVPVIETGVGNCHVYVDQSADLDMAAKIVINAKTQRPGVCNAAETLLVHRNVARDFLPGVLALLREKGVTLHGCEITKSIDPSIRMAEEEDWMTEYLDLQLAVRVVDSLEDAVKHIQRYGTGHSEAIVTEDYSAATKFTSEVDAAAVYINASTRFTDGGQYGLGAEIGISTQKLHARGPMALEALTSTKFIVYGNGQIRD
jgi:glutamate-5-semialdehyde dehydrogenase